MNSNRHDLSAISSVFGTLKGFGVFLQSLSRLFWSVHVVFICRGFGHIPGAQSLVERRRFTVSVCSAQIVWSRSIFHRKGERSSFVSDSFFKVLGIVTCFFILILFSNYKFFY